MYTIYTKKKEGEQDMLCFSIQLKLNYFTFFE